MSLTAIANGIRDILIPIVDPDPVQIGPWPPKLTNGTAFPDRAVSMTPYVVEDNDETGQYVRAVQVRIRGRQGESIADLFDRQDAVWAAIVEPTALVFPTLTVVMAWRQMSAPLGLDAQGRPEIADTYYLRSDRLGRSG